MHCDSISITYDVDRWQRILNVQPIPPRRSQVGCHVPVVARLVWEHDGEQWIETTADAWTRQPDFVHVELADARYRFRGVWLSPKDVGRR